MNKEIEIKYADVFDHCARLSAFEGKNSISATGESNFQEVLITEQDESLIKDYTTQASAELERMLDRMIHSSNSTDAKITLIVGDFDGNRINRQLLTHYSSEAVAAFVMYMWLADRKPKRAEFYQSLFLEMVKSCQSAIYTKRKPTLGDIS